MRLPVTQTKTEKILRNARATARAVEDPESNDVPSINSFVFAININNNININPHDYVLVILASQDRVDERMLEKAVNSMFYAMGENRTIRRLDSGTTWSVQLAPSSSVVKICGLSTESIPLLGLSPDPRLTIIDRQLKLQQHNDSPLCVVHEAVACPINRVGSPWTWNHGVASIACGVQKARISSSRQWQCRRTHSHDSLRNGLVKKCLDIAVHSYQIMQEQDVAAAADESLSQARGNKSGSDTN